jgi:4-alpha-glucanotransferase
MGGERRCGVLLHPTALPGPGPCGTFGTAAADWIRLLGRSGVGVWQLLPLAPTDGTGSPYSSPSGSALNPALLDGPLLRQEGMIDAHPSELAGDGLAAELLRCWPRQSPTHRQAFARWCRAEAFWLRDHCRFMVLRRLHNGEPWWRWPAELARRDRRALQGLDQDQREALRQEALLQWQLQRQWQRLRHLAREQGVQILGDVPFYVAHDSADVWSRPGLFSLGRPGILTQQSGVPPDYFSATGQLWGTPVYRWPQHRISGFRWWLQRLGRQLELVDRLRLDHFRALQAFWSVPGDAATAEHGRWRPSPGWSLLALLWLRCSWRGELLGAGGRLGRLPLVAEDLGVITPDVERLRDGFGLPGMKILQFAFDGDPANPYLPANIRGRHWVVYTGTHDNATTIGWWNSQDDGVRGRLQEAVGAPVTAPGWQLLELALASSADLAVAPLQDLLELGDEARFNTPGTIEGNWCWRLDRPIDALTGALGGFGAMAARYGRGPATVPTP